MNRYQAPIPHAAFAFAAAALAAATLALAVIVPAGMDAGRADVRMLAAAKAVAPAPAEATIIPARIEVIGVREPALAASQDKAARAGRES